MEKLKRNGIIVDEAINRFHSTMICEYGNSETRHHLERYYRHPRNFERVEVQRYVEGSICGLYFNGYIDQVRHDGIWEIKYSCLNAYDLVQTYASQLAVYSQLSGLDVGGFINVRSNEWIKVVMNVDKICSEICKLLEVLK